MNVVFYNHSKRSNSTKLPTEGVTIPCVLKDGCSVISPILEIKTATRPNYNYAYISDFGRYYYVDDWTYYRGIWNCSLSVDVLTSWRSNVLNTTAYVEYSSSNYSLDYTDTRVMSTQEKEVVLTQTPSELSIFSSTGCYILSVISIDANGYNGACAVYALSQSQLSQFSSTITSQNFLDGIWEGIKNAFNNPFDAIVSCRWIPFDISDLSGTEKEIMITYAGIGVNGKLLTSNFKEASYSLPLNATTFEGVSPFTTATLYLPFVGIVELDIDAYYKNETFSIDMKCDVVTGDIIYTVGRDFANFTSTYSGNCATQIPLSNNMVDTLGMVASTAGIIGGIVSTVRAIKSPISVLTSSFKEASSVMSRQAAIQAGAIATAGAAYGLARSAQVHTQTNGALSSRIGARIALNIKIVIMKSKILDDVDSANRIATFGLPCYKTLKLSTLSGYCKCDGASINATATAEELNSLNSLVNSGIYLE